jgi:predicted enzyme related to lactoylglutathione lyase
MPEVTDHQPGTPSWVDLASPDLDRSIGFYGALFGWEASRGGDDVGGYTMFLQDGKNICGAGPLLEVGQPPSWSTYVSVDDADKAAELVQANGGTLVVPPMDVLDVGRMAVFGDGEGAAFSVWQPGTHRGAGLVNEPVSLSWNELHTRDWDAAERFYSGVFNWSFDRVSSVGPMRYAEIYLDGRMIGGVLPIGPETPSAPPHWLAYFAVSDVDATLRQALELGGSVVMPPMNIPQGRLAVLSGPHGEAFAVNTMTETDH